MRQRKLVLRSAVVGVIVTLTFAISARAATEKILHTFTGGNDGDAPESALIFDLKGNLYGTTPAGGAYGYGTVFELSPNSDGSWTESVLYSFGAYAGDGTGPLDYSGLIFDSTGSLYGTTWSGGNPTCSFSSDGCGTIFKLTPDSGGWKETILYNFMGTTDGIGPSGGLILDQRGNLYGMAEEGGVPTCGGYGCGTIFKLSPRHDGGWNFSVLHAFDESDGGFPFTGLSLDPSGLLWGTTNSGGANGSMGVVFNLKRDGGKYQVVSSFDYSEGDQPGRSTLLFGKAGHVFGNTASGGSCNEGTVFMLFPSGRHNYNRRTIDCFGASGDGNTPLGSLVLSPFGRIYGTTIQGGSEQSQLCKTEGGCGTLYEIVWHKGKGWKETVLYRFKGGTDGYYPSAGVAIDKSGNLFGTTTYGGAYNAGAVFEVTP
jgi:uncharacterized repeat protein (TIGR03803 family)